MKLTVATSFPAPERWAADQPEPRLPNDDIVYRITKKGRAYMTEATTSRDRDKMKPSEWSERNRRATVLLMDLLKPGDKIRASKPPKREANFKFKEWRNGAILSSGRSFIAPVNVYSVNGEIIRV